MLAVMLENPRLRIGYSILAFSLLLAGDAWRFTFGWWVFGAITILITLLSAWLLWRQRNRWSLIGMPMPLVLFLTLATASIFWSRYPAATAVGLSTTWIIAISAAGLAITLTWTELLRSLGILLRFILGLSLLFELFVSVVVRDRVLPIFGQPGVDYGSYKRIPDILMWSRNELFEVFDNGRIQGILGNANSLGFLALLALIVFGIQLASKKVSRRSGLTWLLIAAATLLMTKSATVMAALAGVAAVLLVVLLVRRARTGRGRLLVYLVSVAVLSAAVVMVFILRSRVLELLGKSSDLTGRFGIWQSVIDLTQQRPAFGWGWVSYWVPWADPFHDLARHAGIRQLQAHNTWLDVAFQLGFVGLIIFVALVGAALVKAWQHAVDHPQEAAGSPLRHHAITLLPLLVLVALVVQSFAESRLITEYGFALLIIVATKTKRRELV